MTGTDTFHDAHIHETLLRITRHCEAAAGRLDDDELERLADLLLKVCGNDPEYPCRSELEHASIDVRSFDDPSDWIVQSAKRQASPCETTGTLQALIARLLVAAQLPSRKQRDVARLHLWGYTLAETGEKLGIPLSTVISRWRCAKRHLQRAMQEIPSDEWLECWSSDAQVTREQAHASFREEQARQPYRRPRHCRPGRERCRVTGVCACASAVTEAHR